MRASKSMLNKYQQYRASLIESAVTVVSKKKTKDEWNSTVTVVKFSNGKTLSLQKLNSAESMGLPGYHNTEAPDNHSYLGDTIDSAIAEYIRRMK